MEILSVAEHAVFLFGVPAVVGAASGFATRRTKALAIAVASSWLYFLGVNEYTSSHSADAELLQGTFWFFSWTLGFVAVLMAVVACLVVRFILRRQHHQSEEESHAV